MFSNSNQRGSSFVSFSSSSSSTPQWKYDVFLSFRGEDTRNKFTDQLYAALDKKGIVVFRDDEKLEKGKAIALELHKAIAGSRFSVVVFSRNYASSTWCLDELVQIVECMGKKGQVVLPVFYDVDPSEVRKQTGSFQEDFAKHEQVFRENIKKVEEWRTSMTKVANLSGWHKKDRPEAKLIEEIVNEILCKSHTLPRVGLVGIDSRVKESNSCLGEGLNDVYSYTPYPSQNRFSIPRNLRISYTRPDSSAVAVPFTESQLRELFKSFDADKDGLLSRKELENAFNSLDCRNPAWRARQALHHADKNGDGYISENELDELVKYTLKCNYKYK